MKQLLITIAALVLVGCGESQQSTPAPESKPAATAKAPKISIWRATADGNIEVVKQSITDGEDVNAKNVDGLTPLHVAAATGQKEIVELLIAIGANVNTKDNNGVFPLHLAATYGQTEIVELLIAKGTDINAQDDIRSITSLHMASLKDQKEVVEMLIAKGADVNAKDKLNGVTPLYLAIDGGHKEVVVKLLSASANVNAKDVEGDTPLDWARRYGDAEIAEIIDLLRKHGGKTSEELKSSISTDDLETYTLSDPEGTISTLVINPDGSFRESLGFRGEAKRPENTLIGSWKIEGELLVLEGTTELDSKQTIIKFNETTGKIVSINSNGDEVPTEELGRLTIKKN